MALTDSQGINAIESDYDAAIAQWNLLHPASKTKANFCNVFYNTMATVVDALQQTPSGDPTTANLPAMPTS